MSTSAASSRSEVIISRRPKIARQAAFRSRSSRPSGVGMGIFAVRQRFLALPLGICSCASLFVWIHHAIGGSVLESHALVGASAALILAPAGALSWQLERVVGSRIRARWIHAALMASSFLTLNFAIALAFKMRFDSGGVHFVSLHSWLGVITLVLAKISFADAASSHVAMALGIRVVFGYKLPGFEHRRHITAAATAGVLAVLTVVLGLARMQEIVNLKTKATGLALLKLQSLGGNFIAIFAIATMVLTVMAVWSRRTSESLDLPQKSQSQLQQDDSKASSTTAV